MRAQLARKGISKRKTLQKRGQSNGEFYSSNWAHYDKLALLLPAIGASKSRDTLKRSNLQENDNKASTGDTPAVKMKAIAERKRDLLSKCTDAITENAKAP